MYQIPQGWTQEQPRHIKDIVVFHAPEKKGMVSVDFKQRCFRSGWSSWGPATSTKQYLGRGWKASLIADAVEWLNGVLEFYK